MELKEYQEKVLQRLDDFLASLQAHYIKREKYYAFQRSEGDTGVHPDYSSYPDDAWRDLKSRLAISSGDYQSRKDGNTKSGVGREIPNVCLKVPTGGGKTLLATYAIQRINADYFNRNHGMVLWVVPSETIYRQTLKTLCNKEHPYRQMLDRASGGRTKILEKGDAFTKADAENGLCVMLMMQQSINVKNKEGRRVFRDTGRFSSFFPEADDYTGNNVLLNKTTNLEPVELIDDAPNVIQGLTVKHSLGNVLRLLRPIVILDEGHRANTAQALDTINGLNPRFIVELSATPKPISNRLCDVGGMDLKNEQMIKLPINLETDQEGDWQHTLNDAHQKLAALEVDAGKVQADTGQYIRPIMVIKAEPKKKSDSYDHVAAIKTYLIDHLGVAASAIRIKLSEKDELKNDDLLDALCPVRYIITKDALKEGWDCPFAYVLAVLATTRSATSLTQLIGRVMRQPEARTTDVESLNQCYVYCTNTDVNEAASKIKAGLENEGLGDLSDQINPMGDDKQPAAKDKVTQTRQEAFKSEPIFLPQLVAVVDDQPQEFSYEQHILGAVDWQDYDFDVSFLNLTEHWRTKQLAQLDYDSTLLNDQPQLALGLTENTRETVTGRINLPLMASQLMLVIPNPWQATRILQDTIAALNKKHEDDLIAGEMVFVVSTIKKHATSWFLEQSERLFRQRLRNGEIILQLLAEPHLELNWQAMQKTEIQTLKGERPLTYNKSLLQPQFQSTFNDYERNVAGYLDAEHAIAWWHRLAVNGTYKVQGWRKAKVYPDFLIKAAVGEKGTTQYCLLETKGDHLAGNDDTQYKQQLFDCFNSYVQQPINKPVGELKLAGKQPALRFEIIMQDNWDAEKRDLLNFEAAAVKYGTG